MFERIPQTGTGTVTIFVDGKPVAARDGDTVAAALLAAGIVVFRVNAAGGEARGPYCLMGACHDCRVTIDGQPGVQACVTPVAGDMRIELGLPDRSSTGDGDG